MNYVSMPAGANYWYTGNELLGQSVNHNEIGVRQRYIDANYVDMRRKRLQSNKRYGGKTQLWEFDELVSRFGKGTPQFMLNVLRTRMMASIKTTHEKLARDAIFKWAQHQFLGNGTKWAVGTADWSTLSGDTYKIDIKWINDTRLRLAERSMQSQEQGTWANPVPGHAFENDLLVITSPNVMYDIWNSDAGQWMEDLRTLKDERIINGGQFRYQGVTYAENRHSSILYNAGPVAWQCGATSPIKFGDGSPDPDSETVDNIYYVGQSSDDVTHYIQCDNIGTSQFVKGDRISIHLQRTSSYGVTDGVDPFDGMTVEAVVYSVDEATERIELTEPMTLEFTQSFPATPTSTSVGTFYAFVTKGRHVHSLAVIASRGLHTWAARTPIRIHNPEDNVADLPGVIRVTWDEFGEMNRWNPYDYEIYYVVASDSRSGWDQVALR